LLQNPADDGWWYVLEQEGRVVRFPNDPAAAATTVVLDLTDAVACCGESGLVGMAFHPDFSSNGEIFLTWSGLLAGGEVTVTLARFFSRDGGATIDPASEEQLLEIIKPEDHHYGGNLEFGPDGYLYVGFGDSGKSGDPLNYAQDVNTLLGKFLRLDVDTRDSLRPYGIPSDNPFALGGGAPEVWAWGFRNPWRWSFDPVTGDLWTGDVGMHDFEEIDLVVRGGNYGWNIKEATTCREPEKDCDTGDLIDPVVWWGRDIGNVAIGGLVYRGSAIPELEGVYLFSDYGSDDVFLLGYDPITGAPTMELAVSGTADLVDWAYGNDGEAYTLSVDGAVFQLVPDGAADPTPFPATLSATGCVDPFAPAIPSSEMIPLEPALAFWSDGLEKSRWLYVPEGASIGVDPVTGDFDLPIGTVLLKEFRDGATRIETRLFARHADGGWGGYSYRWRADGSDADLLPAGEAVELADQVWDIPSRGGCMQCHTGAAGGALGLEGAQLDSVLDYPTGPENQLDHLAALGMLALPVAHPGPLPALDGAEPVEERARAWLHVNCAQCHRPGGNTPVELDLQRQTSLGATGLCDAPSQGDLGILSPLIVAPGDAANSILVLRIGRRGLDQMPPLGTNEVDTEAVDVISDWIDGLVACP
ncbi:MAG: PQQ-dependent sugar dehydrogenase, partial [Deltaproteobacteria bacterium]|nr:PQQ-dependent sugar dehydrogenase [Deltaproteobacteria bacterium]